MLPCPLGGHQGESGGGDSSAEHHRRRLLYHERRFLAADSAAAACKEVIKSIWWIQKHLSLISLNGIRYMDQRMPLYSIKNHIFF